jgi:phosphate transport system protein
MTRLESELLSIRREVVRMGSLATDITLGAIQAVSKADAAIARRVIKEDEPVDELRFQLDDKLMQSLALNHPLGEDLRGVAAALRICCDLERIGDNAVNIAKSVLKLDGFHSPFLHPALRPMSDVCADMMEGAMDAYFSRDIDRAREVSKRDDEVDAFYTEIEHYFTCKEKPDCIAQILVQNVMIARSLERIADHITNVCEWVLFEVTGVHEELN